MDIMGHWLIGHIAFAIHGSGPLLPGVQHELPKENQLAFAHLHQGRAIRGRTLSSRRSRTLVTKVDAAVGGDLSLKIRYLRNGNAYRLETPVPKR